MKKLQLYECEYCHTQYAKEFDAIKCEACHKTPEQVKTGKCCPFTDYPLEVIVTFDDKRTITYRRT